MKTLDCWRFSNGMVVVFDISPGADGGQVTELQGRYEDVRADVINAAGPNSVFIHAIWGESFTPASREQW